ncbi:MAG: serine/threonine protein kinase [Planctomycetota bacterium]|jgi:tetratricopeptide (TPR) repeat protein/predicted Ser/Thr protein kinase
MTEIAAENPWYRDEDRILGELRSLRASELPTPEVDGYRELREIGRGGQGTVYRARQESTGKAVALKVLREVQPDPEEHGRFLREVEVVSSLAHPGIVKLIDCGEARDGRPFLSMDLVEGLPFDEFARGRSVDEILLCMAAVAETVQHAHQRGVIHRDLKPSNLRIDGEGRPLLLDFGLAKPLAENMRSELVSRSGLFLGSLPWASPEQLGSDAAAVDARSDVYALGVMLYEALCGRPPYPTEGGIRETIQHVSATRPEKARRGGQELPGDVDAILQHCLEKDPARRYQTASELAQDLRRYLAREPIAARSPSLGYLARTWMRRQPALTAALALLFVAALIGGGTLWYLYGRSVDAEIEARFAADKFAAVNEYLLGAILASEEDGQQKVADAVRRAAAGVADNPSFADPLFRAEAHNAVAYWLSSIGDKQGAWDHHEEAMRLRQPLMAAEHPDMTFHYTTLAYFRELHEEYAGAIELMELALDNLSRDPAARESTRAWILRVIGESRLGLGELDAAETALQKSLTIEERIREPGERQLLECRDLLEKVEAQRSVDNMKD